MSTLQRRLAHLAQLPLPPRRRVWDLDRLTSFERVDLARIQDTVATGGTLGALTDDEVERAAWYAEKAGVASCVD